jgi:hypothetical protein
MNNRFAIPWAMALILFVNAGISWAQDTLTKDGVITGTMDIAYNSRTNLDTEGDFKEGSAAKGVTDSYKFALITAETIEFSGEIKRQPKLYGRVTGRTAQDSNLTYNVNLAVLNPNDLKQKKTVGKFVGTVPMDPNTGIYDLAGGQAQQSPLRFAVDTVGTMQGFTDAFAGKIQGKAEKKDGLLGRTYNRVIKGKQVSITVTKTDPIGFQGTELAKGPAGTYPRTIVNGSLDYDYETGNWYANNIRLSYTANGQSIEDVITGTIKWVEDPQRATNGKGFYEFNLRFNEEKNASGSTEGDAFKGLTDEEAFFAVDNTIPCLTGKVDYTDSFIAGTTTPASSKVVYSLNANKLSKTQVVNFAKLWLLIVGPTNDE